MRWPPSTSAASVRSPAGAISIGTRPRGPCPPVHPPSAMSFAGCPTRWSVRPSSTPPMGAIPTSSRCRCTASSSRSRIRSTPRTCARRPAATRATTSTSPRAITCWSHSSGTRARSSSPRRSTRNTTAGPATRADATHPSECCPRRWATSAAPGLATPPTPTTRRARLRWDRARGRACRSAPIWSWPVSARRRGRPAAARPITMPWR